MDDALAGLGGDEVGDDGAVAEMRVALEAQQAGAMVARQGNRLGQGGERFVACHMGGEDRRHPGRIAGPCRIAACLGRAQALQMPVADPRRLGRPGQQLRGNPGLRERGTARTSISRSTLARPSAASTSGSVAPS